MKLKNKIIMSLFCSILLVSCQPTKKLVTGSWECAKIEAVNPVNSAPVTPQNFDNVDDKSRGSDVAIDPRAQQILAYLPDVSKKLQFNADKTAVLSVGNHDVRGSWDVNETARTIVFVSGQTDTTRLTYESIGKNQLSIIEKTPLGNARISYIKQK